MTTTRSTFHRGRAYRVADLPAPQAVQAPSAKGTLQVQPRPSATSPRAGRRRCRSPGTSNSVPLGTPTMPANDAERNDMRKASAAARAAARRRDPSRRTRQPRHPAPRPPRRRDVAEERARRVSLPGNGRAGADSQPCPVTDAVATSSLKSASEASPDTA